MLAIQILFTLLRNIPGYNAKIHIPNIITLITSVCERIKAKV